MDHVYLSKHGELKSGLFYKIQVEMEELLATMQVPTDTFVACRKPTNHQLMLSSLEQYATVGHCHQMTTVRHFRCRLDETHFSETFHTDLLIDLEHGPKYSPFIAGWGPMVFTSPALAAQIRESGLRGWNLERVPIVNRGNNVPLQEVFLLDFRGKSCRRSLSVRDAPNACPHCGREPLFCLECGFQISTCPRCGKSAWTLREKHNEGDNHLILEPLENRQCPILEGVQWDGSDFINGRYGWEYYVTKRAVDWLLSVDAAPFVAVPALVNVQGLSEQQQGWLRDAATMKSLRGVAQAQ